MAEIEGLAQLLRRLRALPQEIQGVIVVDAVRAGGAVLEDSARSRAPVRRGRLAAGIHTDLQVGGGLVVAQISTGKRQFYGRFQEFGTKKLRARPFMGPALDEDGATAVAVMTAVLQQRIESAESLGRS
jgi:HK97 gp10 family phage protein